MDPFFLLQQEQDEDPLLNYTLSSPESLLDSIPFLSDPFITPDQHQMQIAPIIQSAFKTYNRTTSEIQQPVKSPATNVHKSLFRYFKAIRGKMTSEIIMPKRTREKCSNVETTRGFRHMMRERMRRQRMSQGYADLHTLLGSSSLKGDKYTIVKCATRYLEELKNKKEKLQKRHEELEAECKRKMAIDCAIIELQVSTSDFPSADSLKLILRCLRLMNLNISNLKSEFFDDRILLVTVGVVNQNFSKDELQKAVMNTLAEAEKEICVLFPLQNKWCISCHVENVENPL